MSSALSVSRVHQTRLSNSGWSSSARQRSSCKKQNESDHAERGNGRSRNCCVTSSSGTARRLASNQSNVRARTLGFDIQRPRAVILVSYVPSEIDSLPSNVGPDKVVNALASTFSSPADMIAPLARSMIAVATEVEAESTTRDSTVVSRCRTFTADSRTKAWNIRIGLGSRASGVEGLNCSARDAYDAIQLGTSSRPQRSVVRHREFPCAPGTFSDTG